MKWIRILARSIKDAARSVFRNFSLSIASISCITITLIVVSISMILSYNVENITKLIKKDFTIVCFLDNKITQENIDLIESKLKEMAAIDTYEFQSKEEIANSMKESSDVFKTIMGGWSEEDNPLQDTFLIKVKDTNDINKTAEEIKKMDGVSVVRYGEGIIENMLFVFNIVEKALIAIVLSLVVVTAFLISNTIKLTIFSRRKEIEIMRLVGASNVNIRLPFIIEGLFIGIFGAIIPIILSLYGYDSLYNFFGGKIYNSFLQLVNPQPFVYIISLILLGIGIFVGMMGSARAVRKYLKI